MKSMVFSKRNLLVYGTPLLILLVTALLALSNLTKAHPELYAAITYDLILTAPLALFLLSGRKASKFTIALFIAMGSIIAYLVLPETQRFHFNLIRYVLLPVIEVYTMGTILYYLYKTIRGLKKAGTGDTDYHVLFQQSAVAALKHPKVGHIFGSELAMLYYAFFSWQKKELRPNEFSTYKKAGSITLIYAFIFILLIETVGVHLLVNMWSTLAAWVLTALSIYSILMLIAHIKAIKQRPHVFEAKHVVLKMGLFGQAAIPYAIISHVELSRKTVMDKNASSGKITPLGDAEAHNVILYLTEPITIEYMYGIQRSCDTIMLQVDEQELFKSRIEEQLS